MIYFQRTSSKDYFKMQNKCLRKMKFCLQEIIIKRKKTKEKKYSKTVTKQRSSTQAVTLPAGLQQDNNHVIRKTNNWEKSFICLHWISILSTFMFSLVTKNPVFSCHVGQTHLWVSALNLCGKESWDHVGTIKHTNMKLKNNTIDFWSFSYTTEEPASIVKDR